MFLRLMRSDLQNRTRAKTSIFDQPRMHRWAHMMRAPTASQRAAPAHTGCSSHACGAAAPKSAELGARGYVENSRHAARIVSAEVPSVSSVLTSD
eukprot:3452475-Prymnesium_polylepis.1